MKQHALLRCLCLALAAALLTGLCACRGNTRVEATTAADSAAPLPGMDTTGTQTSSHEVPGPVTPDSGMPGSGSPGSMTPDLTHALIRFNDAAFLVDAEQQLRTDEVGRLMFKVQRVFSGEPGDEPSADGDAVGLPEGTEVYAINDDTDYTCLAVKLDGSYYRANRLAEE